MRKTILYPMHNTLSFEGKKLTPIFAKLINDLMYELTGLEGAYKYDVRENHTIFTIFPQSFDFGDDPSELEEHLNTYKEIYEHIASNYPESLAT